MAVHDDAASRTVLKTDGGFSAARTIDGRRLHPAYAGMHEQIIAEEERVGEGTGRGGDPGDMAWNSKIAASSRIVRRRGRLERSARDRLRDFSHDGGSCAPGQERSKHLLMVPPRRSCGGRR